MRKRWRLYAAAALVAALASCAYYEAGGTSRVLAVGIDEYEYVNGLSACVSDAREVAASVAADTRVVIAGEAGAPFVTKSLVLTAIADAAADASAEEYDVFIFHYSGHGSDVKGGVLAMADTTQALAPDTVITVDELLAAIAAVPARVRIVILDSCYSGLFVDEGSSVSTSPGDESISLTELIAEAAEKYDEAAEGDLIVMSAAGAEELSQEFDTGDLAHGYFTMGLLESAEHGDSDKDGLVTLTEAFDYASRYVIEVFNENYPSYAYFPRISGSAVDVVLFKAQDD